MAAETGFTIDGDLYEVPTIDTFTMDEAQVLFDYSGLALEDFVEDADAPPEEIAERERKLRNPGLHRALMHVAYQRRHPKLQSAKVRDLIGKANVISALSTLSAAEEDEDPLAQTPKPSELSENGSGESSTSSGSGSSTDSTGQEDQPTRIGTGRSATSSPESPLTTSAA